jgi:signal peptidase II
VIKSIWIFALSAIGIFVIDQNIKSIFIDGYSYYGKCISFILTYNKGVAFSMFSFLGNNLKYIQSILLAGVGVYIILRKDLFIKYSLPLGILFGAGSSNIFDRFIHGGVVDYVYWHCGFKFAIFNFADVMIDLSVIIILFITYKHSIINWTLKKR